MTLRGWTETLTSLAVKDASCVQCVSCLNSSFIFISKNSLRSRTKLSFVCLTFSSSRWNVFPFFLRRNHDVIYHFDIYCQQWSSRSYCCVRISWSSSGDLDFCFFYPGNFIFQDPAASEEGKKHVRPKLRVPGVFNLGLFMAQVGGVPL